MSIISIIVPLYNVEKYIECCIDSILEQTFVDFDLILVNDGSTDRCGEICDAYAEKDSRVHVIHQKNAGVSAARNAGIEWAHQYSESKWIAFIDSDDWVHPNYLRFLLDAAISNNKKISICCYVELEEYIPPLEDISYNTQVYNSEDFLVQSFTNAIVPWGKLYDKQKFKEIRYPVGKVHEDVYVTHILLLEEDSIVLINAPLYYYRQRPGSIMKTNSPQKLKDAWEGQRMRVEYFKQNNFIKAYEFEINTIGFNYVELQAMDLGLTEEDKVYRKKIRKRIRKKIRQGNISFKKQIWVYELAYPNLMKLYWLFVAGMNRIKNII